VSRQRMVDRGYDAIRRVFLNEILKEVAALQ
jgi:hypothetical protein